MAIRFPAVAKQVLRRSVMKLQEAATASSNIPKGCCAVYVGEGQKKRYVIPISYLNQPLFQNLLHKAEEEFGFDHPTGGLTIPCREDIFIELTSGFSGL